MDQPSTSGNIYSKAQSFGELTKTEATYAQAIGKFNNCNIRMTSTSDLKMRTDNTKAGDKKVNRWEREEQPQGSVSLHTRSTQEKVESNPVTWCIQCQGLVNLEIHSPHRCALTRHHKMRHTTGYDEWEKAIFTRPSEKWDSRRQQRNEKYKAFRSVVERRARVDHRRQTNEKLTGEDEYDMNESMHLAPNVCSTASTISTIRNNATKKVVEKGGTKAKRVNEGEESNGLTHDQTLPEGQPSALVPKGEKRTKKPPLRQFSKLDKRANAEARHEITQNLVKIIQKHPTIVIEGNIGAGKTTIIDHIAQMECSNILTLREPLEKWSNMNGKDLLSMMYDNPAEWATTFQLFVMKTMMESHLCQAQSKIIERSIWSVDKVFLNAHEHTVNHVHLAVLREWYHFLEKTLPTKADIIIYLRINPETVFQRIKQRGRKGEENITREYLHLLHKLYDEWLMKGDKTHCKRVIVVNGDQSPQSVLEELAVKLNF